MVKIKYISLLLSVFAFEIHAQPFPRGISDEVDSLYPSVPQKVTMVESLYRSVQTAASLKAYCPTPGRQNYGNCVAFACAYGARSILEAKFNGWTDKKIITQSVFSHGFTYRVTEPNNKDCNGSQTSRALSNMQQYGVPKLSEYLTECGAYPPQDAFKKAEKNKITGYVRLFNEEAINKQKVQMVKKSISEGNPVVISMICPNSFDNAKGVWKPTESPTASTSGRQHGRHAVCAIGYDDNRYGGAFEILNSWGTNWGNQGFIWITYNDFAAFVYQGLEVLPLSRPKPTPEPIMLKGNIEFVENTGVTMKVALKNNQYMFENTYAGGTRFRIYITNDAPAYVYAFGTDLSGSIFPIFPMNGATSPALTYAKNKVAIPNEENHIRLDQRAGKDYFCIIYSKYPLTNIEEIKQKSSGDPAQFQNRVTALLKDKQIIAPNVSIATNNISFDAKSTDRSLVILFATLNHR